MRSLATQPASNNTAIGVGALFSNTTGYQNTAIGACCALQQHNRQSATRPPVFQRSLATLIGNNNTATGNVALASNTTGKSNTASGVNALLKNRTGSNNTTSGVASLYINRTGNNNTASGFNSLLRNTSGSNNIALGYNAGELLTRGTITYHQ